MDRKPEGENKPNYTVSVGRDVNAVNNDLSFNHLPFRLDGLEIKRTDRWANGPKITSTYHLPHIDRLGAFTGCSIASVRCSPTQFVATVVSTLVSRFRNYAARHHPYHVVVKQQRLLTRAAYYYAVSKNEWFHQRLLALLRSEGMGSRAIAGLTIKFLSKTDDYTRFVYSQVIFQTNWLFSRASWPRDKSIFFRRSVQFKRDNSQEFVQIYKQFRAFREVSCLISSICPTKFDPTNTK